MTNMRGKAVCCGIALGAIALVVVIVAGWIPMIYVSVTREYEFPSAGGRVPSLLSRGASLREIQDAVKHEGGDVNTVGHGGTSLLWGAVLAGRCDVAEWVLQEGANPDGDDSDGLPLCSAVDREDEGMVDSLLRYGADPQVRMRSGQTPLDRAVENGNPRVIEMVVRAVEERGGAAPVAMPAPSCGAPQLGGPDEVGDPGVPSGGDAWGRE
jgi:ankyrin repeat protein